MIKILNEINQRNKFGEYVKNQKLINKILQTRKDIKFLSLDPFNHIEYQSELGEEGVITSDVVEYLLIKLSKKFSGKKVFYKIVTPGYYCWAMHSPFDDIIVAYSLQKDFKLEEAGVVFSRKQHTL